MNTSFAISFNQTTNEQDYIALVKGALEEGEPVPVRARLHHGRGHFPSERLRQAPLLHAAMKHMEEVGKGVVVYLNKSLPNEGMAAELAAYAKAHEHDGQQYFNKLDPKTAASAPRFFESRRPKHDAAQQLISCIGRRRLRTVHSRSPSLILTDLNVQTTRHQKSPPNGQAFVVQRGGLAPVLSPLLNLAYFWRNLSICPAVSTNCAFPV